jgi:hypothetical protein
LVRVLDNHVTPGLEGERRREHIDNRQRHTHRKSERKNGYELTSKQSTQEQTEQREQAGGTHMVADALISHAQAPARGG